MAINQNHTFEELDGIKCCIVEKNATEDRVAYLRQILEFNGFTVVVIPSPPPKTATAAAETEEQTPDVPVTFTIGVTDLTFNPVNAIWGRLLKNPDGTVVSQKQWQNK
jgi:hypothetical protein